MAKQTREEMNQRVHERLGHGVNLVTPAKNMDVVEKFIRQAGHRTSICPSGSDECVCGYNEAIDRARNTVPITKQHSRSLSELVKWFKEMIEQGNMPDTPDRTDELTTGYCDELLEDLRDE